jgi:predicted HicB family RNase H-like nuclease
MAKRGRPKLDPDGSPSKYLTIRVAPGEYDAYGVAAERAETTLSEWVRARLNSAAKREAKRKA